jgi:polysaccharide export outer membrane protein
MVKSFFKRFNFIIPVVLSLIITSCSSSKKIKYFQDIPDSGQLKTIPAAVYTAPTIQVDDILTIYVDLVDPTAALSINAANTPFLASPGASAVGTPTMAPQQVPLAYLVNKDGYVEIPVLGRIKLLGYTTSEARNIILTEAVKYFKNPTVIVRFANFKISVTGEVLKPGTYVVPNEKVSILDALAMAGDLTVFGKRENVLLIRENSDGTKTPYRINLKKSDILSAPYFYLKQNDLIYVEPRKAKSDATDASQAKYITLAGALLSIILVLAYRAN